MISSSRNLGSLPRVLAYDIHFKAWHCGTSWARVADGDSAADEVVVECCQRMNTVEALGLRQSRKRSTYRLTRAGLPLGGTLSDGFGNRVAFDVAGNVLRWCGVEKPLDGQVQLVLESNMFPLTAYMLQMFLGSGGGRYSALLPETGEAIPYVLSPVDGALASSLGEVISFGEDGIVARISFRTQEFEVRRSRRSWPRWSLGGRRGYNPPPDVQVDEVAVASERGMIEASCVRALPPAKPEAIAVFVGGSGAYDRHGFAPRLDLGYHQLLDDLARQGIASVRYEKLGGGAATLVEAEERLDFSALCDDALLWLDWVAEQDWAAGLPRILIGHSLGGIVGLGLAAKRQDIDALVLLSTPGRSFRHITNLQHDWARSQLRLSEQSADDRDALHRAMVAALESDIPWTEDTVDGRLLPFSRQRCLFRSILDLDPCQLVGQGRCPLVIVQGGKDVQVLPEDARLLFDAARKAGRACELIEAVGLDHLLRRNARTGLDALAAYGDRRRRIPIALIRKIAARIRTLIGASRTGAAHC